MSKQTATKNSSSSSPNHQQSHVVVVTTAMPIVSNYTGTFTLADLDWARQTGGDYNSCK